MALTNINGLVPLRQYYQEFNSSSTWTCPTGTTLVDVLLVGGGGGGGAVHSTVNSHSGAAGGGGGGEVKRVSVPVTAGTTYTVTVGAGGSGSIQAASTLVTSGGNGGDSSFGLTRTIANAHYYNHEYAMQLSTYANNSTNTNAFVQPGGWFSKQQNSGYTLASPPAYTLANATSAQMSAWVGNAISSAALTAANVPTGFNGYGYISDCSASVNAYSDLCNWVAVSPSTQYTASAWTYLNAPTAAIRIEWYQAFQGTFISASSSSTYSTNTTWGQLTVTATSPANATYALVRYQALATGAASGRAIWINQQFEQGATATAYKGPFTNGTWTQTGISNVTAGAIAAGGGGGSSIDPNASGSVPGIGGGAASYSTGGASYFSIGGSGSGMGSPVVPSNIRLMYSNTGWYVQPAIQGIPPAHPATGRGGSGAQWSWSGPTPYITAGSASYGVDGYGGGGAGGIASYGVYLSGVEPQYIVGGAGMAGYAPGSATAASGSHAVANSGCGGGGGAASYIAQNTPAKGGNGGSGKVIISYWGY